MNMFNVNEYLKLQRECNDNVRIIKKVGRLFCGPESTMGKMFDLMKDNGIPVNYVDKQFMEDFGNREIIKTFEGIQLRSNDYRVSQKNVPFSEIGILFDSP